MKVWHEICGYLGTHSIGYLAQTCRSLRDQLYSHAPLWDCGIYHCKGSLSQETLKSLSRRRVKFVKTTVFTEADELIGTLRQFALLEELKTLYLRLMQTLFVVTSYLRGMQNSSHCQPNVSF